MKTTVLRILAFSFKLWEKCISYDKIAQLAGVEKFTDCISAEE